MYKEQYLPSGKMLQYYPSVADVFTYDKPHQCNETYWKKLYCEPHKSDWFGMSGTMAEVLDVVRFGWPEGVKKAKEVEGPKRGLDMPSSRRKRKFAMQGMALDPVRSTQGRLDPWRTMHKVESSRFAKKGIATVAIRVDGNCGVDSDQLFWRGVAGLKVAEGLMKAGRKVRILAVICVSNRSTGRYNDAVIVVRVKDYSEVIDQARLYSHIGLSGFFRTVGFRAILNDPGVVNSGLGRTSTLSAQKLQEVLEPISDSSPMLIIDGADTKDEVVKELGRIQKIINEAR